jgi:hypothetical protein
MYTIKPGESQKSVASHKGGRQRRADTPGSVETGLELFGIPHRQD